MHSLGDLVGVFRYTEQWVGIVSEESAASRAPVETARFFRSCAVRLLRQLENGLLDLGAPTRREGDLGTDRMEARFLKDS